METGSIVKPANSEMETTALTTFMSVQHLLLPRRENLQTLLVSIKVEPGRNIAVKGILKKVENETVILIMNTLETLGRQAMRKSGTMRSMI